MKEPLCHQLRGSTYIWSGGKGRGKKSHEDFREEKEMLSCLVVRKFTNKEIVNS